MIARTKNWATTLMPVRNRSAARASTPADRPSCPRVTGTTRVNSKMPIMSKSLPPARLVPVARASQAVVSSQLLAVLKRITSSAVASLPPASRVHRTAEAKVQGTEAMIWMPMP